jgi:WS/DGAT/MGAT family acyltransferase
LVDGIAGVHLLRALLRPTPDGRLEDAPGWWPRRAPSGAELLAGEALRRAAEPFVLARSALGALCHPERAAARLRDGATAVAEVLSAGLRPASETPLNPPRIGPHRRFDWIRLELEQVKEVKRRAGGTVNDVVLATVAGAVGRFLRGRGVPGLERLEFRALVPVSVRREDERGHFGNRVAQILAPLPVGERDPLARLHRVIATTRRLKESRQVRGTELLEELGDWTSAALMSGVMRLAARMRTYNLVVTNVPGPTQPLFLLEAPLLEIYPVVPLFTNQGLGIALFSYHEGLHFGLNSDWDRLPDLHDFADDLGLEFQELRKAAG